MHSAPAVSYPVGRLHFRVAQTLVLVLGAAVLVLWCFQVDQQGWRQALAAGVWLACAGLALVPGSLPVQGLLRWDGQCWSWESKNATMAGTIIVRADWLVGLLLEFHADGHQTHWLWLERGQTGKWEDLRRALWAPGKTGSASPTTSMDRL